MCGRYGVEDRDGEREIFPGQRACVRCADGVREMVWGFRRLSGARRPGERARGNRRG